MYHFFFLILFFLFLTKLYLKYITYIIQYIINIYQKFDTKRIISGFPEDAHMISQIANVANLYPAVTVTNEQVQDMLCTSYESSMDILRNDSYFLA